VICIKNETLRILLKEEIKPADFDSKDNYLICLELRVMNYYLGKLVEKI